MQIKDPPSWLRNDPTQIDEYSPSNAAALVKYIRNGAALFIDINTTPESITRKFTVCDQQDPSGKRLKGNSDFRVILSGGKVRVKTVMIENSRHI